MLRRFRGCQYCQSCLPLFHPKKHHSKRVLAPPDYQCNRYRQVQLDVIVERFNRQNYVFSGSLPCLSLIGWDRRWLLQLWLTTKPWPYTKPEDAPSGGSSRSMTANAPRIRCVSSSPWISKHHVQAGLKFRRIVKGQKKLLFLDYSECIGCAVKCQWKYWHPGNGQ